MVNRTRDGGKSFDPARGAAAAAPYDLVLRHALSIAEGGDELAFGSSTGSLWVTADQGDSWHTVAQHLPPIYSVRYA